MILKISLFNLYLKIQILNNFNKLKSIKKSYKTIKKLFLNI